MKAKSILTADSSLLKSQKNSIFGSIQSIGLDPRDFDWTELKTEDSPRQDDLSLALRHRPTGYYFAFNIDQDGNTHLPEFSPGEETATEVSDKYLHKWQDKLACVNRWLNYVKRETEEPDLWAAIFEDDKLSVAASAPELEDTPFSHDELKQISAALNEIREYIAETEDLSPELASFVNSRINYLEGSAKRQGRKAWIHTTIGVLFTIVVQAAFAPAAARELFQFAANALAQILGGTKLLP